jgi:hypothetical protein
MGDDLIHDLCDSFGRHREVSFYRQDLPVVIVHHIQYSDLSAIHQRTANKVCTPAIVQSLGHCPWFFDTSWHASLVTPADIQLHQPVHPPDPFMVPFVTPFLILQKYSSNPLLGSSLTIDSSLLITSVSSFFGL